jgi:hypothetical protein
MAALETLPGVTEQERSGRHQLAAGMGTVLKCACNDNGNRRTCMLLFKSAVSRSGITDYVSDTPGIPFDKHSAEETLPNLTRFLVSRIAIRFDRNFRQDLSPAKTIQHPQRRRKAGWTGASQHSFREGEDGIERCSARYNFHKTHQSLGAGLPEARRSGRGISG